MRNAIIASSSSIFGSGYLHYILPNLKDLYNGISEICFIPFAQPNGMTYDQYTNHVAKAFANIDIKVKGLHEFEDKKQALLSAKGIFTGGGNTFLLLQKLQAFDLLEALKESIDNGTPYLGTSAGSNICGLTMQTTNDMPIAEVKNYNTLGLLPFNINPHFIKADPKSTHRGETRETRILEYHAIHNTPVMGLVEGSWLRLTGTTLTLKGNFSTYWFEKDSEVREILSGKEWELNSSPIL